MLLPQTKEREYRFKLALRIGLPIFALIVALISHTLVDNYTILKFSFYIESILLLVVSIYFIFYLIYSGFNVKITDDVTKTFTREYLFDYLKKELLLHKEYTLVLISINNLDDINKHYGMNNGDKVLQNVAEWSAEYLIGQKIFNFPMGHIKGGDFIIGLRGLKKEYSTILELMFLKANEYKVGDIEVKISGAYIDTLYSNNLNYMFEKLFEIQDKTKEYRNRESDENISPSELESLIINAINNRSLTVSTQNVYESKKIAFKECYVKLKTDDNKTLHPKSYLKIINKLSLGIEYDLMVLEELFSQKIIDEHFAYAINVSATSLRNSKYYSRAIELVKESHKKILFIISEHEYYADTKRYNSILNSLRKNAILIAIDRLGSLHSSFLYLRELEIDIVRFDTYYSNQEKIMLNRSIIEGFITMAHKKGIKSWIKNIESSQVLEIANEIDVDYTQGRFLSDLGEESAKKSF